MRCSRTNSVSAKPHRDPRSPCPPRRRARAARREAEQREAERRAAAQREANVAKPVRSEEGAPCGANAPSTNSVARWQRADLAGATPRGAARRHGWRCAPRPEPVVGEVRDATSDAHRRALQPAAQAARFSGARRTRGPLWCSKGGGWNHLEGVFIRAGNGAECVRRAAGLLGLVARLRQPHHRRPRQRLPDHLRQQRFPAQGEVGDRVGGGGADRQRGSARVGNDSGLYFESVTRANPRSDANGLNFTTADRGSRRTTGVLMRSSKLKQFGLVMTGMVAGIMISLGFPALADRSAPLPLPVDELRALPTSSTRSSRATSSRSRTRR